MRDRLAQLHDSDGTEGDVPTLRSGVWVPEAPAGGAPSGAAGGDLTGTYPNPTIGSAGMEAIRDMLATVLTAGTNVTITVDDALNTITIASTGGSYTDEQVRDVMGVALTAGTGITITVNDGADTITIAVDTTAEAERIRDVIGTALVAGTGITITVNDAGDIITIDANAGGGTAVGQNLVTNGRFRTNQRAYASAASLASLAYGFDRWQATTAATTLTYSVAPQGQAVTINSGGSISQTIERARIEATGHVLSWTGTATGRVYKVGATPPSYAASPITITPDGTGDMVVEFTASGATKTLDKVKFEVGSVATPYEQPSVGDELLECMRFFQLLGGWFGLAETTTVIQTSCRFIVPFRTTPVLTKNPGITLNYRNAAGDTSIAAATWTLLNQTNTADRAWWQFGGNTGLTATRGYNDRVQTVPPVLASADF